jgi:hypothetical protein
MFLSLMPSTSAQCEFMNIDNSCNVYLNELLIQRVDSSIKQSIMPMRSTIDYFYGRYVYVLQSIAEPLRVQ